MQNIFGKIILIVTSLLTSTFGGSGNINTLNDVSANDSNNQVTQDDTSSKNNFTDNVFVKTMDRLVASTGETVADAKKSTLVGDKIYTQDELIAMSGPKPTDLPLGDNKYVTDKPKVGYIYLCNVHTDSNQGAGTDGPWIKNDIWTPSEKAHVDGAVSWKNATFKNVISGIKRLLTGNNLPINHTTGVYPINRNSTAGKYDQNPNSIKTQNLSYSLAHTPVYSSTPNCMGGESGIMLSGVPLFNGFDAQNRDAQAHEVQDNCDGHPQERGEYHYHGLSSCFKNIDATNTLGFALDGFPITGPKVADGKFLSTNNLDVCHGLTSEIFVDGKKVTTYHYVLTYDFPYSVSCFRGKPISMGMGPQGNQPGGMQGGNIPPGLPSKGGVGQNNQQGGQGMTPPQFAIDACKNKSENTSCTVQTPNGNLGGQCHTTPDGKYFACVPSR